jgi:hypothetical protein
MKSENGVDGRGVTAKIIQNDGKARAGNRGPRGLRRRALLRRAIGAKKRLNARFNFAAAGQEKAAS